MLKLPPVKMGYTCSLEIFSPKKIKNERNTAYILMGYPQCLRKVQKLH